MISFVPVVYFQPERFARQMWHARMFQRVCSAGLSVGLIMMALSAWVMPLGALIAMAILGALIIVGCVYGLTLAREIHVKLWEDKKIADKASRYTSIMLADENRLREIGRWAFANQVMMWCGETDNPMEVAEMYFGFDDEEGFLLFRLKWVS